MRGTRHRGRWHLGLVGKFALASGIVFVLSAVVVSMFASKELARQAQRSARFHAVFVTDRVMRYALEDADTGDVQGRLGRREFNRLDALVRSRILQDPVERVKVYTPSGLIIYSDEPRLVGKRFPGEPDQEVLDGAVVSEVSDLDEEENLYERSLAPRLFSTYTPLWLSSPATGEPDLVVEIYQDYGAIQAEADAFFRSRLLSFGIALVVLWLALLPIMLRADRKSVV